MATKNVKYPGRLGKPIPARERDAAATEAMLGATFGGLQAKLALDDWLARREVELLFLLLNHYGIAPDDKLRWFRLCQKLASAHVPAFRFAGRIGRPRELRQGLVGILSDPRYRPKGKPGRKRKYSDGQYRNLLEAVGKTCVEKGFNGRGAITKALKELLSSWARKNNLSVAKTLREKLGFFRRQYSEGKKRFPELGV